MSKKGFTLLELIIVVAIVALLAAATFVAVNPAKRVGNAQDAQRWADVTAIADAWSTYVADNNGTLPTSSADCLVKNEPCMIHNYAGSAITGGFICDASTTATLAASNKIWLDPLVTGGYLGRIPSDPKKSSAVSTTTGYYMGYELQTTSPLLVVGACNTYGSTAIKVIR
ncbi:MAG: hypothetical protein C3F02_00175 [Parcubacteria group bacterium]|nr:MAG: hypothetical protein C3F02_00175 [Parcubacteria group bacterium]